MNVGEALAASAARAPGKIALSCGDERLTYAQFDEQTTQLARGMRHAGIDKGDRVALHMGNTIEMALCHFACFKLHKVPSKVRFLASLPLGITGKVSCKTLKGSLGPREVAEQPGGAAVLDAN